MGIRTGVDEEGDESSDEEGYGLVGGGGGAEGEEEGRRYSKRRSMSLGKNGFGQAKRERERDWSHEGDASSSTTSAGPHGDSPYKDDVSKTSFSFHYLNFFTDYVTRTPDLVTVEEFIDS